MSYDPDDKDQLHMLPFTTEIPVPPAGSLTYWNHKGYASWEWVSGRVENVVSVTPHEDGVLVKHERMIVV